MSDKRCVLILSGGMDSTTLLYFLRSEGWDVHCLSFNYGQKHCRELTYAQKTSAKLGLPHTVLDISNELNLIFNSALTRAYWDVPHGHYEEESMKATVVPNRNMVMLSMAAAFALSAGIKDLFYGCHAGDHAIYPDCRPEFVEAMVAALKFCHFDGGVQLHVPFLHENKSTICVVGTELKVPYGDTWTCYEGRDVPCGKCGACQERAEAFTFAGAADPLLEVKDENTSNR